MCIAFVTSATIRDFTADDRLAATALSSRGVEVRPIVWSDGGIDWMGFDAIIVRSTWDYHTRSAEFREWIDRLDAMGAPLWNPASVLRWNMEKSYLRALADAGVAVVPTEWLPRHASIELRPLLDERGWTDVVIKPTISATAFRTWRVSAADASSAHDHLAELLAAGDAMVQPFIKEIQTNGEWSLVYLGGSFSHGVRKRPRGKDFRVQSEYGGTATGDLPGDSLLRAARRVLDAAPHPWLYARVDGVETAEGFVLLELEMLEPSLFLSTSEGAPARFADAVIRVSLKD
ncbi:MAG: hypothetical protein ABJE47_05190 [bacterium]